MSDIKDYLNKHRIFKRSVIVEDTSWDNGAMSKWLSGEQGIPDYRRKQIEKYMNKYGFKKDCDVTEFYVPDNATEVSVIDECGKYIVSYQQDGVITKTEI